MKKLDIDDIELIWPDIDPKHIQSEDAVRCFHSAFYDMVEEKYGEYLTRQLLGMPPRPKAKINKERNARLVSKFLKSKLTLAEFAKREGVMERTMSNWFKDREIRRWLEWFDMEESFR